MFAVRTRLVSILLILAAGAATAHAQDLVAVAPAAAKVDHEDARVRIVRLRVPPEASLPMHDRPARIVIPLTNSDARLTRPDGSSSVSRSVAFTAVWSEPTRRTVINLADPIDNLLVELKTAKEPGRRADTPPSPAPAAYLADAYHKWLFENQYVRVYDVTIPPGGTTEFHRHGYDAVSVYLSGGVVAVQREGEPWGKPQKIEPASIAYNADSKNPFTHRVRNDGTAEYRMILVQFLR